MHKLISISEAINKGQNTYFVKPCGLGHVSGRYVSDRSCVQCRKEADNNLTVKEKKAKARKKYLNNKDKILERNKQYRKKNIVKIRIKHREYSKKWRERNPEKFKQIMKEHRVRNYEKVRDREKLYKINNREKILEQQRKRYHSDQSINERTKERRRNDPLFNKRRREHRLKNLEVYRKKGNDYAKQKRLNDINHKIAHYLRSRFNSALKRKYKSNKKKWTSVINLLGCSIDEFKLKISKKFKKGMSWENYGEWHIDHIKALANFDLSERSEQEKSFHYSNLQPLWADENFRKNKF